MADSQLCCPAHACAPTCRVRQLIDSGQLGEVLTFHGDFCLPMGEEVSRLYSPEQGGGALMDIGLYMITIASWVYDCRKPEVVQATAVMHKNGIDVSGLLNFRWVQFMSSASQLMCKVTHKPSAHTAWMLYRLAYVCQPAILMYTAAIMYDSSCFAGVPES